MTIEEKCLFSLIEITKKMAGKGDCVITATRPYVSYCLICDGSKKECEDYIPIYEKEELVLK